MMHQRLACIAALATIVVIGCDDVAGELFHAKNLWVVPDSACVEVQLRKAADDGRVVAGVGEIPVGTIHGYEFEVEAVTHRLAIIIGTENTATFRHTASHPTYNLKELRDVERALTQLESQLSGHCELGDLTQAMQRSCLGKNCDRLQLPPNTSP